jgi:hypothetical protein
VEIKSADITALSVGAHEYKITIATDGSIVCSLDNTQVLSVAESDFDAQECDMLTVKEAGHNEIVWSHDARDRIGKFIYTEM